MHRLVCSWVICSLGCAVGSANEEFAKIEPQGVIAERLRNLPADNWSRSLETYGVRLFFDYFLLLGDGQAEVFRGSPFNAYAASLPLDELLEAPGDAFVMALLAGLSDGEPVRWLDIGGGTGLALMQAKAKANDYDISLETWLVEPLYKTLRAEWHRLESPEAKAWLADPSRHPDVVIDKAVGWPGAKTQAEDDDRVTQKSFDLVTFVESWQYIPDPVGALQWAWSRLKPGGWLAIRTNQPFSSRLGVRSATESEMAEQWHTTYDATLEVDPARRALLAALDSARLSSLVSYRRDDSIRGGYSFNTAIDVIAGPDVPDFGDFHFVDEADWISFDEADAGQRTHTFKTAVYAR